MAREQKATNKTHNICRTNHGLGSNPQICHGNNMELFGVCPTLNNPHAAVEFETEK